MDESKGGKSKLICFRCNVPLEEGEVKVSYLGRSVTANAMRCPECGQAYIPYELVNTKIKEAEYLFEEK